MLSASMGFSLRRCTKKKQTWRNGTRAIKEIETSLGKTQYRTRLNPHEGQRREET